MIDFLQSPGPRERQLQRANNNPLFSQWGTVSQQQLQQARHQDSADLESFITQFQADVEEAVNLKPQADADDVLALKAKMEALYTRACGLQGERSKFKSALKQLMDLISRSLISAANNDAEAMDKINNDLQATQLHLRISESLLAADIINPDDIIQQDQIASSMLSSSEEELASALLIFDPEQLHDIANNAVLILEESEWDQTKSPQPAQRLQQIHQWISTIAKE